MRDGILLASFGGPESPEQILPFLERVTAGRGIARERLLGVADHYRLIGGRSPINDITRAQADALSSALKRMGDHRRVYIGQRHAPPFFEEAFSRMIADGVGRVTVFIAAPYRCEAGLERYAAAISAARQNAGPAAPEVAYVGPWSDHRLFVAAIVARLAEKPLPKAPWVFTAHSIPCEMAKDSTYVEELKNTAGLVAKQCGVTDWTLAYTSRSGNPRDVWLEPDVSKSIASAHNRGVKDLVLIPFGFVADHVEVLFDLDVEAKATADKLGVRLHRVGTVGDHPLFIAMIAEMVGRPTSSSVSSATTVFSDGRTAAKVGRDSWVCFCEPRSAQPPCRLRTELHRPPGE